MRQRKSKGKSYNLKREDFPNEQAFINAFWNAYNKELEQNNHGIEENHKIVEENYKRVLALCKILDEQIQAKRHNQKEGNNKCHKCSSSHECPYYRPSSFDLSPFCPKLFDFSKVKLSNGRLLEIPDELKIWKERLFEFQIFGDWVRNGERVARIDGIADLSTFNKCNTSQILSIVIQQYNEENNN